MGDHENPQFLDQIVETLGGEPIDWSCKVDCCGADIALTHGGVAVELADRIIQGARDAGANCLMCACGLCQINVDMRQSGNGKRLPVFYFTELMGLAMDAEDRDDWWEKHIVSVRPLLGSLDLL